MALPLKTGDRILLALAVAAAVAGGLWLFLGRPGAGAAGADTAVVVVQAKSGFYRAEPLSVDAEFTVETPGTGSGEDAEQGRNTVRIKDGTVQVAWSNCSNQVCVQHDPVTEPGGQIVCLPHGLVVEVAATEDDVAKLG